MEYLKIKEFLEKNKLTSDDMDKIIEEVSKTNWKLKKILDDSNCHWSDLQLSLLQSAITIYNKSLVQK